MDPSEVKSADQGQAEADGVPPERPDPAVEAVRKDSAEAHTRLLRNATAQIGGRLLYLLTRVALPPFILQHVSMQEYGVWATCFLLIGYISMGTFGVAGVYIRYSAQYYAHGRLDEIGRLLGAGVVLTLTFSTIVVAALWFAMPWIYAWFHIEAGLQTIARILILGVIAAMLLDMLFPYAYVLQGVQRNAEQTAISVMSFLLETVLIVVFLRQGYGVGGLLAAFLMRSLFALVVMLLWFPRIVPGLRVRFRGIGRQHFRLFFHYGGILQFIGIVSTFLNTSERVIAGYVTKGVGAVGLLDIGQKFPTMASAIFNAATNSFLSALTHLHSLDRHGEVARLYLNTSRYLNLLNGLAMGFMAPFSVALITGWMGRDIPYREAAAILLYAAVGFHVQALTGPATTYFQAINRPGRTFWWFSLPQLLLMVAVLAWLLYRGSTNLVEVVWVAMWARIVSSIGMILYTNARIGVRLTSYLRTVVLVGLLPYLTGYVMRWGLAQQLDIESLPRISLLAWLAGLGVIYCVFNGVVFYVAVLSDEERARIRGILRRFAPMRAALG